MSMQNKKILSFKEFLDYIELLEIVSYDINLFRGQSCHKPLLPSICRTNPELDTTETEIKMLEDFKRRSSLLITKTFPSDWDWLVYAQHFGLKTRLLDWTSNPLIGLWFACQNSKESQASSYLYVLSCGSEMQLDSTKQSPFKNSSTKILKPNLNNERIIAQSGWFTAHKYSNRANKFIPLETNKKLRTKLTRLEIPAKIRVGLLRKLELFGINSQSVYPDIHGLSLYLNWKYFSEHY